jgi:DNA-binding NtrC family response regulator
MSRHGKQCCVLVVDGNWMCRAVAGHALTRAGYRVLQAETPRAAVVLMGQEGGRIVLVVSEVRFKDKTEGPSTGRVTSVQSGIKCCVRVRIL